MKILTCFIPPTSGDAAVCGYSIYDQSMEIRRKVGYLPENNPLYLDLYVREFLAFMAGMHRVKGDISLRISEMIELTGLQNEQHKKLGALSRGYRQRAGLAQALIHDPEVLILDEPTSGLDPNQLSEIRGLIREIGRKKTVMISTHIMQEVEAICNRVVIIHKGKIVADNTTQNLRRMAGSAVQIRVEFSSGVSAALMQTIPGVTEALLPETVLRKENGISKTGNETGKELLPVSAVWMLTPESGQDIRAAVFRFAVENNLTVLALNLEQQKLEEVFQELTRN
jgi:ABC-2 type transport system ATP-binding protein